jgi:hypothetical protein
MSKDVVDLDKARFMKFMAVMRGQAEDGNVTLDGFIGSLMGCTAEGIFDKEKRVPLSNEQQAERAEKAEDKERRLTQIRSWLTSHEAPIYVEGNRATYKTVVEIIKAMGVPPEEHRSFTGLLRNVLTDGSTGWGLVYEKEGLRFYGASARLLQYERAA